MAKTSNEARLAQAISNILADQLTRVKSTTV